MSKPLTKLKKATLPFFATLIALSSYYYLFEKQESFSLLRSNHYKSISYTDEFEGGKSKTISFTDDKRGINFKFQVDPKPNNYAGFNIIINDSLREVMKSASHIEIELKTQNIKSLSFIVRTLEEGISSPENDVSHRFNYSLLSGLENKQRQTIIIELNKMSVKDWWIRRFAENIQLQDNPDWSTTSMFSFIKESETNNELESTIHLKALRIKKSNNAFLILASLIILTSLMLPFLVKVIKGRKTKIEITYQSSNLAKENSTDPTAKVLKYIAKNFSNPDLKLKLIAKEINLNEREVSNLIKQKLNLGFKQYLNQIRIEEAKRLLIESDLSVKEIAYTVGFNPDHFRKVFNSAENCSPSDFKNKENNSL